MSNPFDGPVAPLWMPVALLVAIVAWIFVCYLALDALTDVGMPSYVYGRRVEAPKWKRALSYALGLPAIFIALGGALAMVALLVASIGSIVTAP